MKSIRNIYKIGKGPSSSHTMGPYKAVNSYLMNHPDTKGLQVTLYGSLAATGKGHLTDEAIKEAYSSWAKNKGGEDKGGVEIIWKPKESLPGHPNGMTVSSIGNDGGTYGSWTYYSIGGGDIKCEEKPESEDNPDYYSLDTLSEILEWCNHNGKAFWEYVDEKEGAVPGFWEHLERVWQVMCEAVERGIDQEGALPGPLHIRRKASSYFIRAEGYKDVLRTRGLIFSYALAVSEENACGGTIVTAPTCGSCGVVPGVLYHLKKVYGFSDKRIIRSLATAGIVGNVVKQNASVSGAEVGCQGEVGVACAMAAAAATQLMGGSPSQIEYAAEMGLEHHLGLTCDPVCGLVQIPCIERNAYAAARALDASIYALYTDGLHRVSFDQVVNVMKETGKDLPSVYKETSEGGLAKVLEQK
ncbi:MAG: L-serine ammonia-lyase [Bacteroidales bacterium]|nr:L-serine ammonia-lyase [Bacteroidales bacterium]MDE7127465.1 L-serine ammonia-lyase [Bacteroidales bacterium]